MIKSNVTTIDNRTEKPIVLLKDIQIGAWFCMVGVNQLNNFAVLTRAYWCSLDEVLYYVCYSPEDCKAFECTGEVEVHLLDVKIEYSWSKN